MEILRAIHGVQVVCWQSCLHDRCSLQPPLVFAQQWSLWGDFRGQTVDFWPWNDTFVAEVVANTNTSTCEFLKSVSRVGPPFHAFHGSCHKFCGCSENPKVAGSSLFPINIWNKHLPLQLLKQEIATVAFLCVPRWNMTEPHSTHSNMCP